METEPQTLIAAIPAHLTAISAEVKAETPEIDLEARAEAYLRNAILRTRCAYFAGNCPKDFREFDAERPEIQVNRTQIDRVLAWQCNPRGIIASGETGRGKTRSMYALCKRLLCDEGRDVAMWHAKDFFSELESNMRYGRDEAGDFVKRVAARPILFIDDFGQEAVSANKQDWAQGWFFRLLDLRMGNRLPLLVTTNMSAKQMAEGARDVTGHPLVNRLLTIAEPIKFL